MSVQENLTAVSRFIDEHRDEIVNFASRLVQTRSVNPPGDEREIAEMVSQEFIRLGLTPKILDHGENYRSVIASVGPHTQRPAVILNGHLDTVPPGEVAWERSPFSGTVEDGFLYGRGASDMKAGDAAMTYAAAALASLGEGALQGQLRLTLTSSEETISKGAKAVAQSDLVEGAGVVLIAEPTNLDIYTAEKGCFWITVTARGKTAHGSMPHCGVNAVQGLTDFLWKLRSHWHNLAETPHPDLGPSTASVNVISGGVGTNVIPDLATANVDIRTIPGQTHEELLKKMNIWAQELSEKHPGLSIDITILNDRAPYEIAQDHDAVISMATSIERATGKSPERKAVAFYTDASIFGPTCGLPVVIFGPGDPTLAHQPNERASTISIVQAAESIALWATGLLS